MMGTVTSDNPYKAPGSRVSEDGRPGGSPFLGILAWLVPVLSLLVAGSYNFSIMPKMMEGWANRGVKPPLWADMLRYPMAFMIDRWYLCLAAVIVLLLWHHRRSLSLSRG